MLSTLIRIAPNNTISSDDTTPDGYFTFTAEVLGVWRTYLLAGDWDDPSAYIVGCLVHASKRGVPMAYAGAGVAGGTFVGCPATSEEAFARMIMVGGWLQD